MRFTEELRAWAREHQVLVGGLGLEEIADRIDGRWEQEEADFDLMTNKIAAQATCLVEVGEALGVSADQPDSEFFWELTEAARGCIQLPKDVDRVPIRIGDRIEYSTGGRDTVRFLTLNCDGWMVNERGWKAETMRHAHPDSWERIISDALRADRTDAYAVSTSMLCELVERCRRLAGDAE